ncbi:MAG: hypothetical protein A3G32_10075 [Deltaproteobacteria bacterium RIFCSPLOWO2_12_FULL_40_28]|nr:MAG: hypothetical protein A3C45_05085 [Deltaproteobacteria bacterium RIFCSPHIGHO2_02_FULL_40_28]OGQ20376.1 MAG: hypothetical protein A3E27_00465 [Deltaproteobacteria bacterium RIFCSPHIGHO2_12_FULL_40_32]OGQ41345.1 MAG: hypothetical protein A3I69_02115 [Deltaproteobacteria bacterium RIFCSPLOWO2_02_FULL_40_36]OGQ54984.1 MAG: hypothetical protein A3G32_10075 [Deltaproteobacteria bacterium RIFCSPLOWO2_12_FULL_40_28]
MKKKTPLFLTIADPVESFNPIAETTFFLLHEVNQRGFANLIATPQDLFFMEGEVALYASSIHVVRKQKKFSYKLGPKKIFFVRLADCVFLRKDPPCDQNYTNHLSLLGLAEQNALESGKGDLPKPLFVNSPSGIHFAGEKILNLFFQDLAPPTLIASQKEILLKTINRFRKAVLKPLNSSGGRGVLLVDAKNPNVNSLIEMTTDGFSTNVICQKFLPGSKKGDKRILLLDGKPLGCFLRVAAPHDFRGNLHSGAHLKKATLNSRDEEIIARVGPVIKELGLSFVGLDVIDGFLTEINTTSPMGINEINQNENSQVEKKVINWILNCLNFDA